jgi:type IV secretory pathway VirB10-like protein
MSMKDDHTPPSYDDISVPASAEEFHEAQRVSISQKMGGGMWLAPWVRNTFFGVIGVLIAVVFFAIFHSSPSNSKTLAASVQPAAAYQNASSAAPVNNANATLDIPTAQTTPPVAAQTKSDAQLDQSTNDALAQAANGTSALADTSHHGMAKPTATLAPYPSGTHPSEAPLPPLATDAPNAAGGGGSNGAAVPNPGNVAMPQASEIPKTIAARIADAQAARDVSGSSASGNDDLYVGENNVGQQSQTSGAAVAPAIAAPIQVAQAAPPAGMADTTDGGEGSSPYLQTKHERPLGQFEIWAGTTIPVQLDTGINTTSGKSVVVAHTSEDIYDSKTGQVLVIPKFSRLIGHAAGVTTSGTSRVSVTWDRIIWLDGSYQTLAGASGTDREGNNGLYADVKEPNVIAASILTGLIAGGAQLLAGGGSGGGTVQVSGGSIVGSSVGGSLAQTGGALIQKKAEQPPELTVPRGQRFSVVLDRTMLLEPWRYDDSAQTDR